MTDRTIVFATRMDAFMGNQVLDEQKMAQIPEGPPLTRVVAEASARGYGFRTLDSLGRAIRRDDLILADLGAPIRPPHALKRLGMSAACYCLESPLIVHDVYHHIDQISDGFPHTFGFPGTKTLLGTSRTVFHPIMWPNAGRETSRGRPWADRELVALVSSNKRVHTWDRQRFTLRHPRQSLRVAVSNLKTMSWRRTDPWLDEELYIQRLDAVQHFARSSGIALYGRGWEQPVPRTRGRYKDAIVNSYRGPMRYEHKVPALGGFRFTFTFENTIFPGYITEKIFEAMFAGSIPVYLGAPDVEKYIPAETFIDAREFRTWGELESYLGGMDEERGSAFIDAAQNFVSSPAFEPFTADHFATRVLDAIDDVSSRLLTA